jgi:hypothetical protein
VVAEPRSADLKTTDVSLSFSSILALPKADVGVRATRKCSPALSGLVHVNYAGTVAMLEEKERLKSQHKAKKVVIKNNARKRKVNEENETILRKNGKKAANENEKTGQSRTKSNKKRRRRRERYLLA